MLSYHPYNYQVHPDEESNAELPSIYQVHPDEESYAELLSI